MSDYITLNNGIIEVKVDFLGAQLRSIKNISTAREYLWQRDEKFWANSAPVLFPVCGGLKGDKYRLNGKEYSMVKHGFACFKTFTAEEYGKDYAVLLLKSDAETKNFYPFDFELRIKFYLKENEICITYSVKNLSKDVMPFSFGSHEGFECNMLSDKCSVVFNKDNSLTRYYINDGLYHGVNKEISLDNSELEIDYKELEKCPYIFKNFKSDEVTLKDGNGKKIVSISFSDMTTLVIWSVKDSSFVCIEPWVAFSDSANFNGEFYQKRDIVNLESEKIFERNHIIKVY